MRGELIPGVEVGRHSPVADLIEACTRDPQRRLFIFADGEWTVSDLANISRACAAELTSHGARQGDRVALVGGNTAMRLAWQFGIWWVGAVEVSVNSELRGHMLSFVLQNAEPTLIVAEREYLEHLPEMSVPRVVVEDVDVSRHAIDVDELDGRAVALDPAGLATILYTSGTSGPSKGVMLPRAYFSNLGAVVIGQLELTPDDIGYFVLPFFHVDAHIVIPAAIQSGSTLGIERRFSARQWWPRIIEWRATWAFFVGAVASVVMLTGDGRPPAPTRLTRMIGGPVPAGAYEHFEDGLGIPVLHMYGQTEADFTAVHTLSRRKRGTTGWLCAGFDIEIHDAAGNSLPNGLIGELVYRPQYANMMTLGYWRRDEATVQSRRGLWFHSGDLARFDDEGFVTFVGRMSDSLRRRGENISAYELEAVMNGAPNVRESAAVPVVDAVGGEDEIKVFVVPGSDTFDADEFFAYCEAHLPRFALPLYLELTDDSQLTRSVGSGVIQKQGLSRDCSGPGVIRRPSARKESTR